MKKKTIAVLLMLSLLALPTGCSESEESGHTEATGTDSVSESVYESTQPAPIGESSSESEVTTAASTTEITTQTDPPEPTEEPVAVNAAELIAKFDNTWLGLPSEDRVYIFSAADKTRELNGETLYGVSCYDEHEGVLYFMCDYYITADGSAVYRWYEDGERLALCPENVVFPELDPHTQSPQEIFDIAEMLYGMFTLGTKPQVDSSDTFEEDGRIFAVISDERLNTKARLLNSLGRYFSDEIINSLMDSNSYIRESADGKLYFDITDIGGVPPYIGSEYEITELTEDAAVFTVTSTWEYEAGERVETYLTYTANLIYGKWKFTSFPGCPCVWSIQSDSAKTLEATAEMGDIALE